MLQRRVGGEFQQIMIRDLGYNRNFRAIGHRTNLVRMWNCESTWGKGKALAVNEKSNLPLL